MNAYLVRKYSYTPAQRRRTTMVLDGQRVGDERDWVLVGFFVTCSSSAEKRFIRPAKQDTRWGCAPAHLARSHVPKRSDTSPTSALRTKTSLHITRSMPTTLSSPPLASWLTARPLSNFSRYPSRPNLSVRPPSTISSGRKCATRSGRPSSDTNSGWSGPRKMPNERTAGMIPNSSFPSQRRLRFVRTHQQAPLLQGPDSGTTATGTSSRWRQSIVLLSATSANGSGAPAYGSWFLPTMSLQSFDPDFGGPPRMICIF